MEMKCMITGTSCYCTIFGSSIRFSFTRDTWKHKLIFADCTSVILEICQREGRDRRQRQEDRDRRQRQKAETEGRDRRERQKAEIEGEAETDDLLAAVKT
jgi:hypothetical protein